MQSSTKVSRAKKVTFPLSAVRVKKGQHTAVAISKAFSRKVIQAQRYELVDRRGKKLMELNGEQGRPYLAVNSVEGWCIQSS